MLRGVQGAVGVLNDGDDIIGGRGPDGFDKEDTLVLTADDVAVLISDDVDGGDDTVNPLIQSNNH